MNSLILKLKIILRAESTLLRIHLKAVLNRVLFTAIGFIFLSITMVMLNIAGYQLLADSLKPSLSAFILAAINFILASIPLVIANAQKPGAEAAMANEIRDMAITEISKDINDIHIKAGDVGQDIKKIQAAFSLLKTGGSTSVVALSPLLAALIQMLKKKNQ